MESKELSLKIEIIYYISQYNRNAQEIETSRKSLF